MAICETCLHKEVCAKCAATGGNVQRCQHHAEERRGRWEDDPDEYGICATEFTCTKCKESFCNTEMTDEDFLAMMKYCPNCGAKMDGRKQTENTCVCCGEIIPEGRQVCPNCAQEILG